MSKRFWWVKILVVAVVILIILGLGRAEYRSSQVVGHSQYRFNMAVISPSDGVTFVSYDPSEKSILVLPFPTNLAINSRSKGEYSISSLYKLGSYTDAGGMFARQKIQGFMRVPIPGYLVVNNLKQKMRTLLTKNLLRVIFAHSETSLSRFDALVLLYRSNRYSLREIEEKELVRAGVITGNIYHPERLQEYVGTRLFDWGIGSAATTVAIVNASGENGLGSDMADFLSNLGLDVVMVRSVMGDEILPTSSWQVGDEAKAIELGYVFETLFSFDKPKLEAVPEEYRSMVLMKVGKDAKELF